MYDIATEGWGVVKVTARNLLGEVSGGECLF